MASSTVRFKNPYTTQPAPPRGVAAGGTSVPVDMPIGPSIPAGGGGNRQQAPAPAENPYRIPQAGGGRGQPTGVPAPPRTPLPGQGGQMQPAPAQPPATVPAQPPAQAPVPVTPPPPVTAPPPATQPSGPSGMPSLPPTGPGATPTFTTAQGSAGSLSGYGQGGVWNSSVVTGGGGGALGGGQPGGGTGNTGGAGTGGGAGTPPPASGGPTQPGGRPPEFLEDRGVRFRNPQYAATDPDAMWVMDQMKAAGVEFLPGAGNAYQMLQNGLTKEQVLQHYMGIVGAYGDPTGYSAKMAGHGANYKPNYYYNQDLRSGKAGLGTSPWMAGSTGPVDPRRTAAYNQIRSRFGQAPMPAGWGQGGGDTVTGGAPEPLPPPQPATDMGNLGGKPTDTETGRGKDYGVSKPGGSGTTTTPTGGTWGGATQPGGQRATAPGMGGGVVNVPAEPPPPTPAPRRTKGGATQDWVTSDQTQAMLSGLARLLGMY